MQVSQGWRGLCIVFAREGNSRLHLSYRGVPVLVTPEQTRHASRDEAELIAQEDLLRELSGSQRGSQRGFIDERGNAPGDPLHAEERHPEDAQEDIPMDQVNDESGPQQDAPKTLLMKMNKDMRVSRRVVNLIHRKQILGLITRLNLIPRLRNLMLKPISMSRCSGQKNETKTI